MWTAVPITLHVLVSDFHEVSVYPKKELPFFILFTAGLCSFTALLALLTHQYPEPMVAIVKMVSSVYWLLHTNCTSKIFVIGFYDRSPLSSQCL